MYTMHNLKNGLMVLAIASILGCQFTAKTDLDMSDPPNIITPPVTTVDIRHKSNMISIKDNGNSFYLEAIDDEMTSFEIINSKSDVRDLAAFGICIYRDYLSSKLKYGEQLKKSDIEILKFCLETQLIALYSYTELMNKYMTMPPEVSYISATENKDVESEVEVGNNKNFNDKKRTSFMKLVNNFYKNDNVLRSKIEFWANNFKDIGYENIRNDIGKLKNTKIGMSESLSISRWRYFGIRFFKHSWLLANNTLNPYSNFTADDTRISNNWTGLVESLSFYINDLKRIYNETGEYIKKTGHAHSKRIIEDYRLETDGVIKDSILSFRILYYDLPFVIFCKKTYNQIQKQKGYWGDDEVAMEARVHMFHKYVSGVEMIKRVRSPYSAHVYAQLLALIKSELSTTQYDTLKIKCKLYEIEELNQSVFGENNLNEK